MGEYDKFEIFDEKIDIFLDHFDPIYHHVPGTSFGFAAVIISSIAIFVSLILYLSVDPTFSIFTHWISHLGAGPNGSSIVFNIGIVITSILLFLFNMYFIKDFRKKTINKILNKILIDIFFISTSGTSLGLIFVAIFPYEIVVLHAIAAYIFFICGLVSSILYAILILITKKNKILALFGFITTAFFCFHLISSIVIALSSGLDIGIAKFTEWLSLFAMLALIIEVGFYHITEKKLYIRKINEQTIDTYILSPKNILKLRRFIKSLHQKKTH